ncbi:helix-turn-helix transcriptional regulator [uncultured Roseobacter sp.]|uniref:helix-turn-helix domain-containing protein n=1 Tax=uncultured Roseobacter sp. TaxID=114847 RepID=UPI0026256CE1|nr:helix-turn-helix transcriptional regulator [uncultured Roseobacter sp.]
MDIRQIFGNNLKHYRTLADMSQAALAVKMGVDRAHVSSMERGQQNVTIITLWHAALALDVRPALLLDEESGSE